MSTYLMSMHTQTGVRNLGHRLLVYMNYVLWFLLELQ